MLVHGLAVSGRYMVPLARELSKTHTVWTPDLPGFGRSSVPRRPRTIDELASDLRTWLRAVGVERPVLAANSMGCQVIVEAALQDESCTRGLVLMGPAMDPAGGSFGHVLRLFADLVREPLPLLPLQAFECLGFGPLPTITTFRDALARDLRPRVAQVRAPVLVVRGERDPIAAAAWCRDVARHARARLVTIAGAGHAINYNSPRETTAIIREFVETL